MSRIPDFELGVREPTLRKIPHMTSSAPSLIGLMEQPEGLDQSWSHFWSSPVSRARRGGHEPKSCWMHRVATIPVLVVLNPWRGILCLCLRSVPQLFLATPDSTSCSPSVFKRTPRAPHSSNSSTRMRASSHPASPHCEKSCVARSSPTSCATTLAPDAVPRLVNPSSSETVVMSCKVSWPGRSDPVGKLSTKYSADGNARHR